MRWMALALLLLPAPVSADCTLAGVATLAEVRIDAPGGAPIEAALEDQPLTVELREGAPAAFRATGALAFAGTVAVPAVPVALRRARRVGPLVLRPGTAILRATPAADSLAVDVRLTEGIVAELTLPCAAVRVGATAQPPVASPAGAPTRTTLAAVGARLLVHRAVGSPGPLTIRIEQGNLHLAEVARRGEWVRVRRDFFDGSTLDGWVRAADVRATGSLAVVETMYGTMVGEERCGHGASHTYVGPATLRAGAVVRAAPDGAEWARATRAIEVRVTWPWESPWVEVNEVEGLRARGECPNLVTFAFVRREDVELPE